jgi:hypothetical protein
VPSPASAVRSSNVELLTTRPKPTGLWEGVTGFFGVRLRSASKVAASGAYGPAGSRAKRDDGYGSQWY